MVLRRFTHLFIMSCLLWACGESGEGVDLNQGNGEGDAFVGGDIDAGSADLSSDSQEIEDVEPPRLCTPGTARCLGEDRGEICNDDSMWEQFDCEENQLCWGGECGNIGTCEPNWVEFCIGYTQYQGCNPLGTGYGEFDVDFNLTCIEDEDGARLVPRTCIDGETMCQDEQVLLACADSGLEYEYSTNCFEDDETTLCDDGACVTLCQFIEKKESYVGCEYWAVDLDNAFLTGGAGIPLDAYFAQFAVSISNPGETLVAEVKIESYDEILAIGDVHPGEMSVFLLPPSSIEGTMIGFEGYRITSTVPIVAYQFNPLENEQVYSNDASLLLPTSSLGTEYYVMTRRQTWDVLKTSITIVATQDGTTNVTMTLVDYTDENPVITLAGPDTPPYEGGDEISVTLEQFEVFNLESNNPGSDFTGTHIDSDRPVAVFGGSEASNAPNNDSCIYRDRQNDWVCEYDRETPCFDEILGRPTILLCSQFIICCADHLEQQMIPVFAWGREFNAVHSAQRGSEADVWRVLASDDDTNVTLVGIPEEYEWGIPIRTQTNYDLDEGEWFEFRSRADFEILSDNPISVGQFLAAEFSPAPDGDPNPPEYPDDAGTGDPAFITGVPREQYREDYIFLVPGEYESNWVSIVVPVVETLVDEDGEETYVVSEMEHTDDSGVEILPQEIFEVFGTGAWAAARMELVNEGYHRLRTLDQERFGAIVMGYDQYVSYGYPAGLDVKQINIRDEED